MKFLSPLGRFLGPHDLYALGAFEISFNFFAQTQLERARGTTLAVDPPVGPGGAFGSFGLLLILGCAFVSFLAMRTSVAFSPLS